MESTFTITAMQTEPSSDNGGVKQRMKLRLDVWILDELNSAEEVLKSN